MSTAAGGAGRISWGGLDDRGLTAQAVVLAVCPAPGSPRSGTSWSVPTAAFGPPTLRPLRR
jgi:hypothetical protein